LDFFTGVVLNPDNAPSREKMHGFDAVYGYPADHQAPIAIESST
jgi:hypothetical protein